MDLIDKALQIASMAHEGQYRKNTKIPYISHPVAVGMILLGAGYRKEMVAAGILHDTVEDTDLSLEDIEREFGKDIAFLVEGCSEPDKSLSWEERKQHTIDFLKNAPEEIRVVACADKLHNVRSIRLDAEKSGEQVWNRFRRGKEQQEWYYRNVIDSLGEASNFPLLEQLKIEVEQLFQ
ncbi:HD domain-containing protein [Bacillus sp. ISL-35]|uniref:HD domain-containing protein n=1 Tax=Bacillus sp. ISL-35 TaxID=2819122 RepID=UPI001BE7D89C|nr:HD domain-containing protein [Bacillus sp. ISL-35]MBT2679401.1 HD domain-containing protein [Bacillus sp. ISL-35]MBT2703302.1 HD domain-containing protein [Chryseobacterium sp. ISL-80]